MLAELTRVDAGWPLALSLAVAIAGQGLLAGRRRMALNEALHELRRPIQALVLAAPSGEPKAARGADLPRQTALALERLDREINGGQAPPEQAAVRVAVLLEAALGRCRRRAETAGASIQLNNRLGDAVARIEHRGLDRALDNLIINAVEHGGPRVVVGAELAGGALRLIVRDSGPRTDPRSRRSGLGTAFAALSGRRRHGHGLRVVRRVAASHGGRFHLRRFPHGAEAVLELPLRGVGLPA